MLLATINGIILAICCLFILIIILHKEILVSVQCCVAFLYQQQNSCSNLMPSGCRGLASIGTPTFSCVQLPVVSKLAN